MSHWAISRKTKILKLKNNITQKLLILIFTNNYNQKLKLLIKIIDENYW